MSCGNGDGTLAAPVTYSDVAAPAAIAVGDVNRDGSLDVILAEPNTINVFLGCTFTIYQSDVFLDAAAQTSSVSVTQRATVATFTDVTPSAFYFDYPNLVFTLGITNGCSTVPLNFCPNDTITRGQMAKFLVIAVLGSSNFTYNPVPYFADVLSGAPFFTYIQKLKELGITKGCSAAQFCPNGPVTRDQMAAFIIRARYGSTPYTWPSTPYFTDVPASDQFFFLCAEDGANRHHAGLWRESLLS